MADLQGIVILTALLSLLPAFPYCRFLVRCILEWRRPPCSSKTVVFPRVAIVLPVRNEAANILQLLGSVDSQLADANKVEVIVVDDHSDDDTVSLVTGFMDRTRRFPLRLIRLSDTYSKKSAIAAAVNATSADWIVTLDADVIIPSTDWLVRMMHHASTDTWMLCGPVLVDGSKKGLVSLLARLESIGLMSIAGTGIRSESPLFCNGANLAFRREKFLEYGGYELQRLSGDDTDLLHRFPARHIRFLDDHTCLLRVAAPDSWSAFISQRQRWASKIPDELARPLLMTALSAWWTHLILIVALFFSLTVHVPMWWAVFLFSVKAVIEYQVLKASQRVHRSRVPLGVILLLQPVYCILIVIIGFLSVTIPYRWKGRTS